MAIAFLLTLLTDCELLAAEIDPTTDAIRTAITKSIPLLELGSKGSIEQRKQCFNCHNQGLPLMAMAVARSRGFSIDEDNFNKQVQFTADFLTRNKDRYREGEGQGGQVDTAGYALWALDNGGYRPDETTAAVAEYFLLRQKDREHWRPESTRPPSEKSYFTSSYVALRGLSVYGTAELKERIDARIATVREWILKTEPEDTEDRVFRLRAFSLVSVADDVRKRVIDDLLARQRADGGWSQLDDMESDAYATGTVLVALIEAGGVPASDARIRKGLAFLLSSQQEDGSWHVVSRSKPFQTYFESGYPHGKDQFISMAAASWATTALAFALPQSSSTAP